MSFTNYFKNGSLETSKQINEAVSKPDEKKDPKNSKNIKITTDFETELRKLYKIKSVINTAFGVQVDFYKKPERDEILALVDSVVKFKGNSIFIEF
jgi:hypothetical protein